MQTKFITVTTVVKVDEENNISTSVTAKNTQDKLTMLRCLNMGIDAISTQMAREQNEQAKEQNGKSNIVLAPPMKGLRTGS